MIYPQEMLVSAKKKPWMFEIFSICLGGLSKVAIKSIFFSHLGENKLVDFTSGVVNTSEEIGELAIKYGLVERPTTMSYTYKDYKWVGAGNRLDRRLRRPAGVATTRRCC